MAGFGNAANKFKARDLGALVLVKSVAGQIYGIQIITAGVAAFVQIFDAKQTADVTLGTTTPDLEVQCPINATTTITWGNEDGVRFDQGIVIASTTAEKGAVASAAGVQAFLQYK